MGDRSCIGFFFGTKQRAQFLGSIPDPLAHPPVSAPREICLVFRARFHPGLSPGGLGAKRPGTEPADPDDIEIDRDVQRVRVPFKLGNQRVDEQSPPDADSPPLSAANRQFFFPPVTAFEVVSESIHPSFDG
jgi:hypothetical protein